jgi:GTP cyclohydrolase I
MNKKVITKIKDNTIEWHVKNIICRIGENPQREGLRDTPRRVAAMYKELTSGYNRDIEEIFTTFDKENYNEMVILRHCEFYSLCEHHLMPFFGMAHVGYIPNERVIGISKLARLVNIFAKRLQTQERMTVEIVDALEEHLEPKGSMCVIKGSHLCMRARGVNKQNSDVVTSAIRGRFKKDYKTRTEFLDLIRINFK